MSNQNHEALPAAGLGHPQHQPQMRACRHPLLRAAPLLRLGASSLPRRAALDLDLHPALTATCAVENLQLVEQRLRRGNPDEEPVTFAADV